MSAGAQLKGASACGRGPRDPCRPGCPRAAPGRDGRGCRVRRRCGAGGGRTNGPTTLSCSTATCRSCTVTGCAGRWPAAARGCSCSPLQPRSTTGSTGWSSARTITWGRRSPSPSSSPLCGRCPAACHPRRRSFSTGTSRWTAPGNARGAALDTARLGDRRVHASLEPATISGDPVLAERLVANLVDNAARHNVRAGEIWLSTGSAGGSSVLTVANTGPVVRPVDTELIFQPFQRLNDRTSHDGVGLGLAIVASIAAVHGGTVTARPRDGGGLFVLITIPSTSSTAQSAAVQPTDRSCAPSHADTCSFRDTRRSRRAPGARGCRPDDRIASWKRVTLASRIAPERERIIGNLARRVREFHCLRLKMNNRRSGRLIHERSHHIEW
jgi:hypothetical protein